VLEEILRECESLVNQNHPHPNPLPEYRERGQEAVPLREYRQRGPETTQSPEVK
jgi:hypothetical protein